MKLPNTSTTFGFALAALAGVAAVVAIQVWPQKRHDILVDLGLSWALINVLAFGGPRLSLRSTPRELFSQIRESGYRTPVSVILFTLIIIALGVYVTFGD